MCFCLCVSVCVCVCVAVCVCMCVSMCVCGSGVMVWVGLNKDDIICIIKGHIIGPIVFNGSITGDSYLNLLQTHILPAIRTAMDDEDKSAIFQQDEASAHWLDIIFEDRWMGRAGP